MADPNDEQAFDPATWTPDKPWPKGYYKPIIGPDNPDYIRWPSVYYRRRNGIPAGPGFSAAQVAAARAGFWLASACVLQLMDAAFVRASRHPGLAHAIFSRMTPWPLFVAFALMAPTLLYVRMMPAPSFQRAALYGLGWSLVLLALRFLTLGLPAPIGSL